MPSSTPENYSQQFVTQISLPSRPPPTPSQSKGLDRKLPDASGHAAEKNGHSSQKVCLLDYATPTSSVSAFCRATLRKLIPREFFGEGEDGISNQKGLMVQVDRFIRISRFESLSLHEVCNGVKVRFFGRRHGVLEIHLTRSRYQLYAGLNHHPAHLQKASILLCPISGNELKYFTNLFITFSTPYSYL